MIYYVIKVDGKLKIGEWEHATKPMMECGHAAQGTMKIPDFDNEGQIDIHVCVICDCKIVIPNPTLDGRMARCPYCKKETPSRIKLPFFQHREGNDTDSYYCGCRGWD